MTRRRAAGLAWSLFTFVVGLGIATAIMGGLAGQIDRSTITTFTVAGVVFLTFAWVGATVASRRPGNPIGWLFLAIPALMMVANAVGAYVELAVDRSLPGAVAVTLALGWTWPVGLVLLLVVALLFPDGSLPSPRWRPLIPFAVVWLVASAVLSIFPPGPLEEPLAGTDNPIGNDALNVAFGVVALTGLIVMLAAAIASLVIRFRRDREQREQIKWVLASVVLVIAFFLVAEIMRGVAGFEGLPDAVYLAVLGTIPAAMGIAILKYRLYEIDRIVNRAVVYGLATAGLAALYFGIVLALQQVFGGFTRGNDLAIAGSTLAVAALFRPARRGIQDVVDRRFYRRRYDAEQTLRAFGARLRDEVDLDTLGADLGEAVHETLQPTHVSLWLRYSKARL